MQRLILSKVASYLYHHQSDKEAYIEIWNVLEVCGLHQKTPINHEFSKETQTVINNTINKLEADEKAFNQKLKK
jgi:hypothetical protein